MSGDSATDDGKPWGFMHAVAGWVELPKGPGLRAMGPPPFDVTLPDGRTRRVVHKPEGTPDAAIPPADSAAPVPDVPDVPDAPDA
jgi:hypothetical protein